MKHYLLGIDKRFIRWVDKHWYETCGDKSGAMKFDTITSAKETVNLLRKHYVYKPIIYEVGEGDTLREVIPYERVENVSYVVENKKLQSIKCKIKL